MGLRLRRLESFVRASNAPESERASVIDALVRLTRHRDAFTRYDTAEVIRRLAVDHATRRFVLRDDVKEALVALAPDTAMPVRSRGTGGQSTAWSVGRMAEKALGALVS